MDIVEQRPIGSVRSSGSFLAGRMKFVAGGVLIIAAIVYLIWTSATANAQYFMTVDEVKTKGASIGNSDIRVSGAIIGDSITYDSKTLKLEFVVANTPGSQKEVDEQGGLAAVLHAAVIDPNRTHLTVVYTGVKPDLMRNEAQAIMTGKLGSDGVFYASELLLKCPTKYEAAVPDQVQSK
jgi:cytochrome c-type biogenesis protein CcmE